MIVTIAVRTVQRGLYTQNRANPRVLSPGTVDGRWGPRTQASLDSFVRLYGDPAHVGLIRSGYINYPVGAGAITLDGIVASQLTEAAREFNGPEVQDIATADEIVATRENQSAQVVGSPFGPATVIARSDPMRTSSFLPIMMGLGAAGLLFGLGYLFWKGSKGGRRGRTPRSRATVVHW